MKGKHRKIDWPFQQFLKRNGECVLISNIFLISFRIIVMCVILNCSPVVGVICFIVHNQPIFDEIKWIRSSLKRMIDHLIHCIRKEWLVFLYFKNTSLKSLLASVDNAGKSYICSTVFLLWGIQKPNSKSNVFNRRSRKKWRSIILKLFTGFSPTTNSTL